MNRVARNWEMSERFTRRAFNRMCAGRRTVGGWGPRYGVGLSLGYCWHQCSIAPWEAALLYSSVSPTYLGLTWGGGAATEASKGNETVETGGRHGTEQAPATAVPLVTFPVHTHTPRFSRACGRLPTTLAIEGHIVG